MVGLNGSGSAVEGCQASSKLCHSNLQDPINHRSLIRVFEIFLMDPSSTINRKPHILCFPIEQYLDTHHLKQWSHPNPSRSILNQFNPSQFSTHPFPFSPNQLTSCTGPLSRPRVGTLVSPFKPYLWFGQIFPEVHEDEVDNEYDIDDDLWRQPGRIQLWRRFGLLQGDRVDCRTFVTVPAHNDNDYKVMGIMSHII